MAERDREGHNRENRAAIFIHMVYLSLIGMCLFNWIWQNYIRPEVTIPLGMMSGRLDHMEDLQMKQNDILDLTNDKLDFQIEKLGEHTDQLKLLVTTTQNKPV